MQTALQKRIYLWYISLGEPDGNSDGLLVRSFSSRSLAEGISFRLFWNRLRMIGIGLRPLVGPVDDDVVRALEEEPSSQSRPELEFFE